MNGVFAENRQNQSFIWIYFIFSARVCETVFAKYISSTRALEQMEVVCANFGKSEYCQLKCVCDLPLQLAKVKSEFQMNVYSCLP